MTPEQRGRINLVHLARLVRLERLGRLNRLVGPDGPLGPLGPLRRLGPLRTIGTLRTLGPLRRLGRLGSEYAFLWKSPERSRSLQGPLRPLRLGGEQLTMTLGTLRPAHITSGGLRRPSCSHAWTLRT